MGRRGARGVVRVDFGPGSLIPRRRMEGVRNRGLVAEWNTEGADALQRWNVEPGRV